MQFSLSLIVLAFAASTGQDPREDASRITWLHDDWAAAKALAKSAKKLVAVDVWATWCHSCLSMKHFVLTDARLAKVSDRHVWLQLDYDKPVNGQFLAKFPVASIPAFLVIDPTSDTVVARWIGSGSAKEMARFFRRARVYEKSDLVLGQRALAKQDHEKARRFFEHGLQGPGLAPSTKTALLSGLIEALWKLDQKVCAEVGMKHLGDAGNTAPGIDIMAIVAMCAESQPLPIKEAAMRAVRDRLAPLAEAEDLPLTVDDRSALHETLISAYDALGDKEAATKIAEIRLAMLEHAAERLPTAQERATYDAHRFDMYLRLGDYEKAESMLRASENAQPMDFNHSWRLAVLYEKQGRTVEGLAAIDRALSKGYGGRRLRLYATKIDLLIQKKNTAWARKLIDQARGEIPGMNPSQIRPAWIAKLDEQQKRIDALGKAE